MIIDTCEIIMNNHTCEIIDFISGEKINKPRYFNNNNSNNKKAAKLGRWSIIKNVEKYSKELGLNLQLIHTNPIGHTEDEEEIGTNKIGMWIWMNCNLLNRMNK